MQNSFNSMDWGEFEKQMLKQFPFLPKHFTQGEVTRNASWVNDYVQKTINHFLNDNVTPGGFNPFISNGYNYDLFETHRSVIVRLHLPRHISPHDVRTSINQRKLRFSLPSGKKQEIRLEKAISPKRSRAVFKEGILEVRMPKIRKPESFQEVYLDE